MMRFHHQLLPPNTIFWEPYRPIEGALAQPLQALGYTLEGQAFNGDVQLVKINGDTPEPVADPRKRGVARVIRSGGCPMRRRAARYERGAGASTNYSLSTISNVNG